MQNSFKIAILLFYYNRPSMVLNAIESINRQNYKNKIVYVIDDGSEYPILDTLISNAKFDFEHVYIPDTPETKKERGGSIFGKYANDYLKNTDADYSIMLCDDDALYTNYLTMLNKFYLENPNVHYSYSHIVQYDPEIDVLFSDKKIIEQPCGLNHTTPINPFCRVDASQVSWSVKKFKEDNIRFPYPQTVSLDAEIYRQMHSKWGDCIFNGVIGQYKAIFKDQLGRRNQNDYYNTTIK